MNDMKKLIVLLSFLLAIMAVQAQPPRGGRSPEGPPKKGMNQANKENLEAQKVAYLTAKANLTSDEAAKFWPVYNRFDDERKALKKQQKIIIRDGRSLSELASDSDIEKALNAILDLRTKEIELERKYLQEFKKVLPMKKIAIIVAGEKEFYSQVLRESIR
jgi:hypothetical protein